MSDLLSHQPSKPIGIWFSRPSPKLRTPSPKPHPFLQVIKFICLFQRTFFSCLSHWPFLLLQYHRDRRSLWLPALAQHTEMRWVQPSSWSRSTSTAWLPKPMPLPHYLRLETLVYVEKINNKIIFLFISIIQILLKDTRVLFIFFVWWLPYHPSPITVVDIASPVGCCREQWCRSPEWLWWVTFPFFF